MTSTKGSTELVSCQSVPSAWNDLVVVSLTNIPSRFLYVTKTCFTTPVVSLSNADTRYMRNYIRHEMMDHVLKVNPGIHKMVRKRLTMDPNHAIVKDNYEIAH